MPKEILLIGTVHIDPRGPERLEHLLNEYDPEVIALEGSQSVLNKLISKHQHRVLAGREILDRLLRFSHLNSDGMNVETAMKFFEAYGYEGYVSHNYAKNKGIPLVSLENDGLYDEAARQVSVSLREGETINMSRALAEQVFKLPLENAQWVADLFYFALDKSSNFGNCVERNRRMANEIIRLDGRVAVIVGGAHVYGLEPSLKSLLSGYKLRDTLLANALDFKF